MKKSTVLGIALIIGTLGVMLYLLDIGNQTIANFAYLIIFLMGVIVGGGLVLITLVFNAKAESARFRANMGENIQMMGQIQRAMNAQNSQLMKQNNQLQTRQIEAPQALLIDDGIFSDLE